MDKKEYMIPQDLLDKFENTERVKWTYLGKNLSLWNKNGMRWQRFSKVKKMNTRRAYIGLATKLDPYWKKVIVRY